MKSKEVTAYEKLANSYGITNGANIGDRVVHPVQGKGYIVEGLNTRAGRYPVQVSNKDDRYNQFNQYEIADY